MDRGLVERIRLRAEVVGTLSTVLGHVYRDGSSTPDLDADGPTTSGGVWPFPGMAARRPTPGRVSLARNVPTNYATEWLRLLQSSHYVVTIHTQWQLPRFR